MVETRQWRDRAGGSKNFHRWTRVLLRRSVIGDSRTVGLHDYGGLDDQHFLATVGMNVYNLWTEKFCEVDGEKVTLEEALKAKKYGKIYFQIGINEMGRGTLDGFMTAYEDSVEKFRELQPDAVIFVQGIMKVAKKK